MPDSPAPPVASPRRRPPAAPARTDNTAALVALGIGAQAAYWPLHTAFVGQWMIGGHPPWRLPPMARGDVSEVVSTVGVSWLGAVFGCAAVLYGYAALRRAHAGAVTGGGRLATAGVALGTLGIFGSLIWAALVALTFPS